MELISEYAGTVIFGIIIFLLITYTIRTQIKQKGKCDCGNSSCPKSSACNTACPEKDKKML